MSTLDLRNLTTLEGRILVHGEEESPDAATSYSKELTRDSTMFITLPKSKRPEIAGSCERILSFNFEGRVQKAARR